MKTIYYISRSYPEQFDTGGGALMRQAQVNSFKSAGYNVVVVLPNYQNDKVEQTKDNILLTPYKINERLTYFLHGKGILECYLSRWVKTTVNHLKNIVKKEDIVFATTGGEIGTLIIASELKKHTQCKTVFNYHDPIAHTTVFGLSPSNEKTNLKKNQIEGKYLKNIDLILTSSKLNKEALLDKHNFLKPDKIQAIYFGYLKDLYASKNKLNKKTTIVYGGSFAPLQQPELLIKAAREIEDIEVVYIGNHQNYAPIQLYKDDCTLLPAMSYEDYINYIQERADIGFVALTDEYYGACVPSKIFEYLNIGLPIIGALPNGDAMDIINQNNYGLSCHFNDVEQLKKNIKQIVQEKNIAKFKQHILNDRTNWGMHYNSQKLLQLLSTL